MKKYLRLVALASFVTCFGLITSAQTNENFDSYNSIYSENTMPASIGDWKYQVDYSDQYTLEVSGSLFFEPTSNGPIFNGNNSFSMSPVNGAAFDLKSMSVEYESFVQMGGNGDMSVSGYRNGILKAENHVSSGQALTLGGSAEWQNIDVIVVELFTQNGEGNTDYFLVALDNIVVGAATCTTEYTTINSTVKNGDEYIYADNSVSANVGIDESKNYVQAGQSKFGCDLDVTENVSVVKNALSLRGTSYVNAGVVNGIDKSITVEAWIKPSATNNVAWARIVDA